MSPFLVYPPWTSHPTPLPFALIGCSPTHSFLTPLASPFSGPWSLHRTKHLPSHSLDWQCNSEEQWEWASFPWWSCREDAARFMLLAFLPKTMNFTPLYKISSACNVLSYSLASQSSSLDFRIGHKCSPWCFSLLSKGCTFTCLLSLLYICKILLKITLNSTNYLLHHKNVLF